MSWNKKPLALLSASSRRRAIDYSIAQASRRMDQRRRTIALAIHLVQATRFEAGRHQEAIGARFYQMGQLFVEADTDGYFSG